MKELIISILLLTGSFFILIASIGLIRFRDIYSRLHASTKATSFGILMIIIAVAVFFDYGSVYIKTFLLIIFIYITAPLAAHSIAKASKDKE